MIVYNSCLAMLITMVAVGVSIPLIAGLIKVWENPTDNTVKRNFKEIVLPASYIAGLAATLFFIVLAFTKEISVNGTVIAKIEKCGAAETENVISCL